MAAPEAEARQEIDEALAAAGWVVQDLSRVNLYAAQGVAVREVFLKPGHGKVDYLLFVDQLAVGVLEAKKVGMPLSGVEDQARRYAAGLPDHFKKVADPLPFVFRSTGVETWFTNLLEPDPRSRRLFHFHRPEDLARWLKAPLDLPADHPLAGRPAPLRARLHHLPPLPETGLWPAQRRAVENLERSLCENRPRALIQMATGSGKTFTAITSAYRLIKWGGAERVLFLVDRANLGRQALKEFQQYATPDDGRKFTEIYNVQHLTGSRIDPAARVTISTIQRLYSLLQGKELAPEDEERSLWETAPGLEAFEKEPRPVVYNPQIPLSAFDVIFIDECHRSIYSLWRQVVEYFDAFLIGLTATPSKQTFGFFQRNLVMEYSHQEAVADGVNVGFDLYRIRTRITEQGATVEAETIVDRRDRLTRKVRWEELDDDLIYPAAALDRDVVAIDQLQTVIRTFRDKLPTEIFPGRRDVPKTLIFAKDDSHAEDIVEVVRREFGKGDAFAKKITYRSVGKPEDLISEFRTSYPLRIAVTVDMIATGTDIKPIEIVMFLRTVKSRSFFEQMKGRGVRVISAPDFQSVTPGDEVKDHFVIVDCVGVCEAQLMDSAPLERLPRRSFEQLLNAVALGSTDADLASSLAGRLARLDRRLGAPDRARLAGLAGGLTLPDLVRGLIEALDPDLQEEEARRAAGLPAGATLEPAAVEAAGEKLLREALRPLAANPGLRAELIDSSTRYEQTIDVVSQDEVLEAGYSEKERQKAEDLVHSFESFLQEHHDQIVALQVLFSRPYRERLRYRDVKELAQLIEAPPRSWTREKLWAAYEKLRHDKVRGAGDKRLLTDIVSLVRYALAQEDELVPFRDRVEERFRSWLAQQETRGRRFTEEQREWLELIRDHVAASLQVEMEDFDSAPFAQKGGAGRAYQVFGDELGQILDELNEVLAA